MKANAKHSSFVLIFIIWAAGIGAAAQFAKIAVFLSVLADAYPDAGRLLGFTLSLVGFVGIVFGVVAGMIVAQVRAKPLLCSALLLGALASLYQSSLPTLPMFLLSRLLEGVSHLAIVVSAPTLIAHYSSHRHRSFSMTLWGTFFGVAFALTALLAAPLVAFHGLPSLFISHAVYMLLLAAVLFVCLPESDFKPPFKAALSLGFTLRQHRLIYCSPSLSAPAVGWFFYTATYVALLTVLPDYVEPSQRLLTASAMPLASIALSMTAGVVLLGWMPAFRCVQLGFALALCVLTAIWMTQANVALCVALAAVLGLVQGASFASVPQINPDRAAQALANGAVAQSGNLGNTLGPPLLLTAASLYSLEGVLVFAGSLYLCGIAAHQILMRLRRN